MTKGKRRPGGLMRRLRRDRSGNVVAITAAAVIPMIGVVGGAIDISRLYLTKSRIQAACDSAVLAGRKAMTTNIYTTEARNRANTMFNFNFQDADYGTTGTTFLTSANSQGVLTGNASTNVPMALMHVFGFGDKALDVVCSADIQVPNIDIVFVLDVTGSMKEEIGGVDKIDSMKAAAKDFYTTMAASLAGNTQSQVRYGFVPYSQTINVKELFTNSPDASKGELPRTHLATEMEVQSRVANFNTATTTPWMDDPNSTPTSYIQRFDYNVSNSWQPFVPSSTSGTNISTYDCDQYSSNRSFNIIGTGDVWMYPATSYNGEGNGNPVLYRPQGSSTWQTNEPNTGTNYSMLTFTRVSSKWSNNGPSQYRTCERRVTMTNRVRRQGFAFTNWEYRPINVDVSDFRRGTPLNFVSAISGSSLVEKAGVYDPIQLHQQPDRTGMSSLSLEWDGCIEERDTVAVNNFAPIPSGAKDLNFLLGGTSADMRWRTNLAELTYNRKQTANRISFLINSDDEKPKIEAPSYFCPNRSVRNLNVLTQKEFNDYIDSLSADGNTYLDMGMVWGLRLIHPNGMFASRNRVGPNGNQISRHIIFLTDGNPVSNPNNYSSYGTESMARRITGSANINQQANRHSARFQALCDAGRSDVSIWAVAFGTSVTSHLSGCADPGRAYQANNQAQLQEAFRSIAQDIADLRLVQ